MSGILLTQDTTFIIGPVAKILGYLMEGIFFVINKMGIPNVGLAIILFTIVIYLLMMPLTIKQQKFSKLNAKMSPELQAIQARYKGKKDNESMNAMNAETKEIYAKYGVSPTGSCLQLVIQMPILFALYRVIYAMPAYVGQIKEAFLPVVNNLINLPGSADFIKGLKDSSQFQKHFTNELFTSGNVEYITNTYIDCLNKASTAEWASIAEKFPTVATNVSDTLAKLDVYNNFLGLNIANSPSFTIKESFASGSWLMIIAALMIPLLSAATQWINVKLMPQAIDTSNNQDNPMASSMKTMNMMMPIMSAVFCFTLPAGMGLYWIAGSVVRSIQQVAINKHIDKMDLDAEIKKNIEKRNKKLLKAGIDPTKINANAKLSTKSVNPTTSNSTSKLTQQEKDEKLKKALENNNKNVKPGSIAEKANLVKQYNENNNK